MRKLIDERYYIVIIANIKFWDENKEANFFWQLSEQKRDKVLFLFLFFLFFWYFPFLCLMMWNLGSKLKCRRATIERLNGQKKFVDTSSKTLRQRHLVKRQIKLYKSRRDVIRKITGIPTLAVLKQMLKSKITN